MEALLIIDFQQAVLTGTPPAHRVADVAGTLRGLALRARGRRIPVIFLRHSEPGGLWDPASPGWPFTDGLAPAPGDDVVDKLSCDGFRNTGLDRLLQARSIRRLFVCGYATEFCVDTTIRAAAARGIDVIAIEDGHTTRDRPHLAAEKIIEHHNWIWRNIANPGNPIGVRPSTAVLSG